MMKFITPVIAFLVAALMIGAWLYIYFDITASAAEIASYQDQVATVASRDAFLRSADDFVAQTSAEQRESIGYLTPAEDTASSIVLIEDAGRKAKVVGAVQSATIVPTGSAHHETLEVVVTARGTFAAHGRFIALLEALPRASMVTSVHMEASDNGWVGTYTVSFVKLKL
jgi:hypothetical protein